MMVRHHPDGTHVVQTHMPGMSASCMHGSSSEGAATGDKPAEHITTPQMGR